ncbi:hypothetical protein MSAN_00635800 [Mycena sanguinolenta]|uniref:Uncharacterized protein n=1 Tax=Mycena sanguinolenta TaxID=230812 RepID=A0A8H6Z0Q4_9AGAR|nr:hypothetical protein MSAN_00635800 [Mycena sanguinolenta]
MVGDHYHRNMPTPSLVKASNATFRVSYVPVAVFVGATSGVGQGMVEAFARYVHGRAHIIIVGRNQSAATKILAGLPKPRGDNWKHEFVPCDVSLMANVRSACAEVRVKCSRINFLVLTAGYNSMVKIAITDEGLDLHLAMRYYQRFVWIQELLPLIQAASDGAEHAKVMCVLDAGRGNPLDLNNIGNTVKPRKGRFTVALRSMVMSSGYTDAMLGNFAAEAPGIAFTHIHPGVVRTNALAVDFDGIRTPAVEECAEHMLYALFTGERGLFLRDRYGNVISERTFDGVVELGDSRRAGLLDGVTMRGYAPSDYTARKIVEHTRAVTGLTK